MDASSGLSKPGDRDSNKSKGHMPSTAGSLGAQDLEQVQLSCQAFGTFVDHGRRGDRAPTRAGTP